MCFCALVVVKKEEVLIKFQVCAYSHKFVKKATCKYLLINLEYDVGIILGGHRRKTDLKNLTVGPPYYTHNQFPRFVSQSVKMGLYSVITHKQIGGTFTSIVGGHHTNHFLGTIWRWLELYFYKPNAITDANHMIKHCRWSLSLMYSYLFPCYCGSAG